VLLKDYLRELPDPLCTSSLYQMLMDALCVQEPNDDAGNAQLMFSILDCLPTVNQVGYINTPASRCYPAYFLRIFHYDLHSHNNLVSCLLCKNNNIVSYRQ